MVETHLEFTEGGLARETTKREPVIVISSAISLDYVFIELRECDERISVGLTPGQARYIAELLCARATECDAFFSASAKAAA